MLNKINISPDKQILIVYIFLTVVTLSVFWQVNQHDFISIDDNIYVTQNNYIKYGITLEGIRWAFSTTYAEWWHPLTWLSLMFDYQLYGVSAGGYHVTNLILHILSTLLLFWLFNRMTGTIWRSAFVAALFALHPLHVESVAWIAERKDVLSAFFWMLTLCLYVYYTKKTVIRRYLLVLSCFVFGLMSKSMLVTLPVIMILLDYWPLGRFESRKDNLISWQLKEKIPFFVFSAVFSINTIYTHNNPFAEHFPLGSRLANAPISFITYLAKILWPHDLTILYPFSSHISNWHVLGASLLILIISTANIAVVRGLPYLFVGWLWYAITIIPVLKIVEAGNEAMADRYTYLPSIGIGIILAWGIPLLFPSKDIRKKILFPVGIATLAILSVLTWKQCGYWKNSDILLSHALQVKNDNHLAHNNFGLALFAEGKTEEAIDHYNQAICLQPNYAIVYNSRGMSYDKLGQYQRAIEDFNKAISLKSDYVSAYNNRGVVYFKIGQYYYAIADYNEAIRLKPDDVNAYNNRGGVYFYLGNNELGCYDAEKACSLGNCNLLEVTKSEGYCH